MVKYNLKSNIAQVLFGVTCLSIMHILIYWDIPSVVFYILGLIVVGFCFIIIVSLSIYFRKKGVGIFLIALPLSIFMSYGLFVFIFVGTLADKVTPPSWQWPVGGETEVLVLKSGKKAIALKGAPRIQIYDATGEYLGGWYIHNIWETGDFKIVGTGEQAIGSVGAETLWVQDPKKRKDTLFNLEGQILLEKDIEYDPIYYGLPHNGKFERIHLETKWYLWPLYNKKNGINLAIICILGLFILDWIFHQDRKIVNITPIIGRWF